MESIKYVIRFFKDDQYLYSVHCDQAVLDDLMQNAKDSGYSVKVVAYRQESEE